MEGYQQEKREIPKKERYEEKLEQWRVEPHKLGRPHLREREAMRIEEGVEDEEEGKAMGGEEEITSPMMVGRIGMVEGRGGEDAVVGPQLR